MLLCSVLALVQCYAVGDREILTEGKLLLLACESGSLQGFGLHSRKKAGYYIVMFCVFFVVSLLTYYIYSSAINCNASIFYNYYVLLLNQH